MKAVIAIFLSVSLIACGMRAAPPTDEELISRFESKRAVFDGLREMMCRDGYQVVSMDPEWSKPTSIPTHVKNRYYQLFRDIGVLQVQSYDGCRMQFSVWAVGWAGDGDYKQYQYRPVHNNETVDVSSLNNLKLGQDHAEFYLRKIAEDWYLEYAHWP